VKLSTALTAAVIGLSASWHHPASAVAIVGSSGGSFSHLTGCDKNGDDRECGIVSTSNGANTQVRWPYRQDGDQISYASTLTSVDVAINTASNANDVLIARLDWFNAATNASITPDEFGFRWALSIAFANPNVSVDSEEFTLSILNTSNPTGDSMSGFTLADLSNLAFNLNGLTVSDLHYSVMDGWGTCEGIQTSINVGVWYNCEGNTASLLITADFTDTATNTNAVNEPATLAIMATGLLGLAALRRRKTA
jgi:hypothetical protein